MYEDLDDKTLTKLDDLNTLYEEFLKSFQALSNEFKFTYPFNISMLYQYMINNNLFLYNSKKIEKDIETIHPFNYRDCWQYQIFTGRNVCRHNSKALNDILNYMNYVSLMLYGTSKIDISIPKNIDSNDLDIANALRKKYRNGEIEIPEYIDILDILNIPYKPKRLKRRDLQNISFFPNHVINLVESDNKLFFIDTTLDILYRKAKNHYDFLTSREFYYFLIHEPETIFGSLIYTDEETKLFSELMNNSNENDYKDSLLRKEVFLKLIRDNKDIISKYKENNRDLFKEIRHKCLALNKRD